MQIKNFSKLNKLIKKDHKPFRLSIPSPDFIPYACHIDPKSILTKNGDVLQVIKISGYNDLSNNDNSLIRESIRKVLSSHVNSSDIGVWVHTIRTRRSIDDSGPYPNKLSSFVHQKWSDKNYWQDKFINEIYITIVIRGQEFKLTNFKNLVSSLTFDSLTAMHNNYVKKIHQRLQEIVNNITNDLKDCGAEILKIKKEKDTIRSEPVEFFSKIINLKQEELTVPIVDLSKYLVNHKSAFGNNSFEIGSGSGKYFGAIFSIKEYHETDTKNLDKLLLLPEQMVITQTISFIDKKSTEEHFKYQDYILDVSLDGELRNLMGLKSIMDNDKGGITDFGESQITVMISADSQDKLIKQISRINAAFSENGFLAFREDLAMEDMFWSQLPGNFQFLRRKSPIPFSIFGGFLSINSYPAGNRRSIWGAPVTIFRSVTGTPFFFNFHSKDESNNVLILGPTDTYKSMLARFLILESQHLSTKTIYVTSDNKLNDFAIITSAKKLSVSDFKDIEYSELNNINIISTNDNFADLIKFIIAKTTNNFEGKCIIVIDDINELIKQSSSNLNVIKDLLNLKNPNVVNLNIYNSSEDIGFSKEISDKYSTKIYTPDPIIKNLQYLKPIFSSNEMQKISSLNKTYKHFMVKQDNTSVILEFNITGINDIVNILTGNMKDIKQREILA